MSVLDIRVRELEASVKAHRAMLASEHERASLAFQQIIRIGQELGGEQFDQLLKGGQKLEDIPLDELAGAIIGMVKSGSASSGNHLDGRPNIKLGRQLDELKRQVDFQTKRAVAAEEEVTLLKKQAAAYESSLEEERKKNKDLESLAPPPAPVEPAFNYAEWFDEWSRSNSFERTRVIVALIGDSGYSRKSDIQKQLEIREGTKRRSAYKSIELCEKLELLRSEKGPSTTGRPADLVFLTSLGEWVYTKLMGKSPKPNEFSALLKAHKSNHHIALILKAADLFSFLGFDVEREPAQIKIVDNRYYQPDLIVKKGGETYYLEVETGEFFDRPSLLRKWENASIAGGGRICVVTPTIASMTTSQSQIHAWAINNGKKVKIFLTNLEALHRLKNGDSPWVRIKQNDVAQMQT
ncbi:MAG: hypothetical protein ABSB41_02325 [Anaerolineales bacterium]|jgi:hypothetical protein